MGELQSEPTQEGTLSEHPQLQKLTVLRDSKIDSWELFDDLSGPIVISTLPPPMGAPISQQILEETEHPLVSFIDETLQRDISITQPSEVQSSPVISQETITHTSSPSTSEDPFDMMETENFVTDVPTGNDFSEALSKSSDQLANATLSFVEEYFETSTPAQDKILTTSELTQQSDSSGELFPENLPSPSVSNNEKSEPLAWINKGGSNEAPQTSEIFSENLLPTQIEKTTKQPSLAWISKSQEKTDTQNVETSVVPSIDSAKTIPALTTPLSWELFDQNLLSPFHRSQSPVLIETGSWELFEDDLNATVSETNQPPSTEVRIVGPLKAEYSSQKVQVKPLVQESVSTSNDNPFQRKQYFTNDLQNEKQWGLFEEHSPELFQRSYQNDDAISKEQWELFEKIQETPLKTESPKPLSTPLSKDDPFQREEYFTNDLQNEKQWGLFEEHSPELFQWSRQNAEAVSTEQWELFEKIQEAPVKEESQKALSVTPLQETSAQETIQKPIPVTQSKDHPFQREQYFTNDLQMEKLWNLFEEQIPVPFQRLQKYLFDKNQDMQWEVFNEIITSLEVPTQTQNFGKQFITSEETLALSNELKLLQESVSQSAVQLNTMAQRLQQIQNTLEKFSQQ